MLRANFTPSLLSTTIHNCTKRKGVREQESETERARGRVRKYTDKRGWRNEACRREAMPYLFHLLRSFNSALMAFPWAMRESCNHALKSWTPDLSYCVSTTQYPQTLWRILNQPCIQLHCRPELEKHQGRYKQEYKNT